MTKRTIPAPPYMMAISLSNSTIYLLRVIRVNEQETTYQTLLDMRNMFLILPILVIHDCSLLIPRPLNFRRAGSTLYQFLTSVLVFVGSQLSCLALRRMSHTGSKLRHILWQCRACRWEIDTSHISWKCHCFFCGRTIMILPLLYLQIKVCCSVIIFITIHIISLPIIPVKAFIR